MGAQRHFTDDVCHEVGSIRSPSSLTAARYARRLIVVKYFIMKLTSLKCLKSRVNYGIVGQRREGVSSGGLRQVS
jgi:hypothetical protein